MRETVRRRVAGLGRPATGAHEWSSGGTRSSSPIWRAKTGPRPVTGSRNRAC